MRSINHLCTTSALFCGLDLQGERVQVDKKKSAQLMHLIGHFFGGLLVTMHSVIAVKPQLMRPRLQLRGDPVFGCHSVDTLLQLPCLDIGREGLEAKFHCPSIHAARRIEVACLARARRLIVCPRHWDGNPTRSIALLSRGIKSNRFVRMVSSQQITLVFGRQEPGVRPQDQEHWLSAVVACCSYCPILSRRAAVEFTQQGEPRLCGRTMRAIMHKASHNALSVAKREILA